MNAYLNTTFGDLKKIYNKIRNFFFDFLLNVKLYKQTDQFNLLINLNSLVDSLFEVIQSEAAIEKLLNENILEKLLNFIFFLFKLKDNDDNNKQKQKKEDKNIIS